MVVTPLEVVQEFEVLLGAIIDGEERLSDGRDHLVRSACDVLVDLESSSAKLPDLEAITVDHQDARCGSSACFHWKRCWWTG